MKPQATIFNVVSCAHCNEEQHGKEGELFNGFLDADTGHNVCSGCSVDHYRKKRQTEHKGKLSEIPLVFGLPAFGTDTPIQEVAVENCATADLPGQSLSGLDPETHVPLYQSSGEQQETPARPDIAQQKAAAIDIESREDEINGITCLSSGNFLGVQVSEGTHVKDLLANLPEGIIPQAFGQEPEKICCWTCAGPLFHWEKIVLGKGARGDLPIHADCWKGGRKPPRAYPGSKGADGVFHTIINQFPPHHTYIELFAGSGQILQKKKPAKAGNIAVERSREVISTYAGQWPTNTEILDQCAIVWLKENAPRLEPGTLIYLDPPYPMDTRRNSRDLYKYELSNEQHRQLAQLLLALPQGVMVSLSSYQNPIYDEILKDWRLVTFKAQTRGGEAIEALYMNYPEPEELHQYNLLGKDRIERQQIKRKVASYTNKLKNLPPLHRNAILASLRENELIQQ